MGNNLKRHTLSLLIAVGGCVAGAYSAYAAFSNGNLITDGAAGTMFGLAFAAVVIISWIMLPWADKRAEEGSYRDAWLWRVSWLMALGFVLANSIVYTVHYRTEMTENRGLKIDAYERARQVEAFAAAEISELRTNPRWDLTSGCSNVTAEKSKLYCERVHDAQARIQNAEAILGQGRPAAKDSGAETLAWVLGADESKVRRSLPIFWAVILELIASLCMREAFATLRGTPQAARGSLAEPAGEKLEGWVPARAAIAPEVPAFGIVSPLNSIRLQMPLRGAMNDNMPLAAYA
ncbi:MAG: hypothetical protein ACLQF2_00685 [Rhodomicrobium sp.]